jgi:Xaa-Pro aminopeptidase
MSEVVADFSVPRGFQHSEYEDRVNRVQALMHEQQVDALLLMTEAEVRYFSGFQTLFWQSPTRPWFLIVPPTGKPIAVVPKIGADVVARGYVDRVLDWSSPHPSDDGVSLLAETLHKIAGATGRVGIPMGAESTIRMPLIDLDGMRNTLSQVFIDATPLIRSVRQVKSDAEIEKIKTAAQIASAAFANAPEIFHSGQPLIEAFRNFKIECLNRGADDVPYLVGGADHAGYTDIISSPTQQPLSTGDVLMLDTGVTFDGYYCDFDRNFSIGPASDDVARAHETLWTATQAGLSQVRPGVRCQEIFAAMNNEITRAGYKSGVDVGRYGHGLGMQLTEWPSIASFDRTALVANMVLTLEPSLIMPNGKMMVAEENLVVTAKGNELLSNRASKEIVTLPG